MGASWGPSPDRPNGPVCGSTGGSMQPGTQTAPVLDARGPLGNGSDVGTTGYRSGIESPQPVHPVGWGTGMAHVGSAPIA